MKYMSELRVETIGRVLIAKKFPRNLLNLPDNVLPVKYYFENLNKDQEYDYEHLLNLLKLERVL